MMKIVASSKQIVRINAFFNREIYGIIDNLQNTVKQKISGI